jgi:transposase
VPAPYSRDLRTKIVEAREKGRSLKQLAADFGVSVSFITATMKLQRETGSVAPRPRGGGRRPALDTAGRAALAEIVKADPGATLEDLKAEVSRRLGVSTSVSALCRVLGTLGLPRRKSQSTPSSGTRRRPKR